jgi:hypothetical protein
MFESLVKEAKEEGNLEESVVRKHAKSVGSISYFFRHLSKSTVSVYNR